MLVECGACHGTQPTTVSGGPHGMHPVGQAWVSAHHDVIGEGGDPAPCQACHGADYRGTVLSRAKASRTLSRRDRERSRCGRASRSAATPATSGPHNERSEPQSRRDRERTRPSPRPSRCRSRSRSAPAIPTAIRSRCASSRSRRTARPGSADTLATYIPEPGFAGIDRFTFAAWDGSTDSNLGTVTVNVGSGGGTTTTTLPGGLGPDLTGHWVSLSQKCAGMGAGLRCTVHGKFTVVNQGTALAGRSKLRFVLDGATLTQRKIGKLKPGRAATKRFSATLRERVRRARSSSRWSTRPTPSPRATSPTTPSPSAPIP